MIKNPVHDQETKPVIPVKNPGLTPRHIDSAGVYLLYGPGSAVAGRHEYWNRSIDGGREERSRKMAYGND